MVEAVPIKLDSHKCAMVLCNEDCIYQKSCANHTSAGDFRSEGGVRPRLSLRQGVVVCATKNAPVDDSDDCQTTPKPQYTSYWRGENNDFFQGFLWRQLIEEVQTFEI